MQDENGREEIGALASSALRRFEIHHVSSGCGEEDGGGGWDGEGSVER